jgi:SAM-dependent methyltransferase
VLARELGLDGRGRLLDVGCGPGILAGELASLFSSAVGLDPDAGMLAEAAASTPPAAGSVGRIGWVRAVAELLPFASLPGGTFRVVTFGQSFHWTDREAVAEAVYDLLEPGGAIVLVAPTVEGRPVPDGPDHPPIPHDEIRALVEGYIGSHRWSPPDRYEDALGRTRFGRPQIVFAPGRADIVRDVDSILANLFSMSWAAPPLFGDRLDAFVADLRALLASRSPSGLFWDWPGDTEVLIGRVRP